MDWGQYEVYDPGEGVDRPLHELPRPIARATYRRAMETSARRLDMLRTLLARNGVDVDADDWLEQIGAWFIACVERDPNAEENWRLLPRWYSVCHDLWILLGERLVASSGGRLQWDFDTGGPTIPSHHRHVVRGTGARLELMLPIAREGHAIVSADGGDDYFRGHDTTFLRRMYDGALATL